MSHDSRRWQRGFAGRASADDLRIRMVLPTLEYLIEQGAKIILCTHMGRPKGQRVEKYSLAPVASYLAKHGK